MQSCCHVPTSHPGVHATCRTDPESNSRPAQPVCVRPGPDPTTRRQPEANANGVRQNRNQPSPSATTSWPMCSDASGLFSISSCSIFHLIRGQVVFTAFWRRFSFLNTHENEGLPLFISCCSPSPVPLAVLIRSFHRPDHRRLSRSPLLGTSGWTSRIQALLRLASTSGGHSAWIAAARSAICSGVGSLAFSAIVSPCSVAMLGYAHFVSFRYGLSTVTPFPQWFTHQVSTVDGERTKIRLLWMPCHDPSLMLAR